MPEVLKKPNGEMSWERIFMGIGMAVVLILQQWQSYRIAEIKVQGEVNKVNFMSKEAIERRLEKLESKFMDRSELMMHIKSIDERMTTLERKVNGDK